MDALAARLESATFKICGGGGGGDGEVAVTVSEWNSFYSASVQPFIDACNCFEETKKLGAATEIAMQHAGVVIEAATQCAKPEQADFVKFLDPIVQIISSAQDCDNRSDFFPQFKSFGEAIQCLNWLMAAASKPVIVGQLEAADFYLSKVLTKARDAESPAKENLRAYVKTLKAMLTDMGEYGQNFHKQGITWKFGGGAVGSFKPGTKAAPTSTSTSPEDKISNCISQLEAHAAKSAGGDDGDGDAACVVAFKEFYSTAVQPFLDACNSLEGTKKLGSWAEASFKHMGAVIAATTTCKKPTPEAMMAFLGPIATSIGEVMNLNPAKSDEWFNHEKSFCEGLQSLNWLCMDGLPRPYIQGQLEASDFYLTKCLSAGKDLDDTKKAAYRAYVKTFKELLKAEAQFAVDFFKTGLSWKAGGSDLPKAGAAPAAAAAKPANPLAAKPNPLAAAIGAKAAGAKKAGGFKLPAKKAAPAVTEGKIDKSQMNKIFVERYNSKLQKEPVIVKVDGEEGLRTGVFIGNCTGPNLCIKIEGKIKNITISNCHQVGIIFDNCVTTVEVIGSKRCQIQATEIAGSYIIDKCDRTQIFLAEKSVEHQVVMYSAQSTCTNVLHSSVDGEDTEEFAVPDQMLSTFVKGKAPTHEVVLGEEAVPDDEK